LFGQGLADHLEATLTAGVLICAVLFNIRRVIREV
jgi:hypothetical protein